jgi:hypothetical protein
VLWFGLSTGQGGQQCSSIKNYQFPPGAQQTIVSGDAVGARLVDGGQVLVTCQVYPADANGAFDINADVSTGEVGNFSISGRVTKGTPATVNVDLSGTGFRLGQDGCTANVEVLSAGAVWLKSLSCPTLKDQSSPSILCVGNGGVILENCSR